MRVIVSEFMDGSALTDFGADIAVHYVPGLLAVSPDADAKSFRNCTGVDARLLAAAPNPIQTPQVAGATGEGNARVSTVTARNAIEESGRG